MDLRKLIESALVKAMAAPLINEVPMPAGVLHAARSREWMAALAAGFEAEFASQQNVEVFWRGRPEKQGVNLGRNEMLHDLLVCEVAETPAARRTRIKLSYIRRALWQVESEFAKDSREAMNDFVKLVLGSAAYKLFVGPQGDNKRFINALLPAAQCCTGEVWLALIPHPDSWLTAPPRVDLWRLAGRWEAEERDEGNGGET